MKKKPIYTIRAKLLYICPICKWRCTLGKAYFKEHMKDQHQIGFFDIKLIL